MSAWYLGLFWVLYYILHSAFASEPVKRFFKELFPSVYPHYRAMYSTIAVVNFVLLAALHVRFPSSDLFLPGPTLQWLSLVFGFSGLVVLALALKQYGFFYFRRESDAPKLLTEGLNAHVRHPLYFGILLLLVALICCVPSAKNVVFALISAVYLVLGTMLEERKLIAKFGSAYEDYQKRTRMLVPYLF